MLLQPLGQAAQCVEYFLPCLCHSALLCLALGGQPFSFSNDEPQKSVSRATEVPYTLRGSFACRVFYLHFPRFSARVSADPNKKRWGVRARCRGKKYILMMSEYAERPCFSPASSKSSDPSVSRPETHLTG